MRRLTSSTFARPAVYLRHWAASFVVLGLAACCGRDEDKMLRLVAAVERASEHPLAQAIAGAGPHRPSTKL